jgi:hypothetical protein
VVTTYTITASAGTGGTITPSGIVTVNSGTSKTFTIKANWFYRLTSLKVDGVSVSPTSSYTFTNILKNHTIAAGFTRSWWW